ncbi:hypothetical protein M422DRAFT_249468 [Sphaerobolus stellatus SS14]|uniref:Unplaced genomic scaffold SPHSTscaffold_29, whole genome shotgun sequence n=1 Tax=Sphaerobolus stellatus (strain SS14) TaxID=990650 RepID=A0A0C9W5Q6_SPHS4|nr:hypothetical protein M422DRAFT_249468 [Sphaerobolus stellatus SS14]
MSFGLTRSDRWPLAGRQNNAKQYTVPSQPSTDFSLIALSLVQTALVFPFMLKSSRKALFNARIITPVGRN